MRTNQRTGTGAHRRHTTSANSRASRYACARPSLTRPCPAPMIHSTPQSSWRALLPRLAAITVSLFAASGAGAQTTRPTLPYAGGYLVTGNYTIAGVDVTGASVANGFATGTITLSGVPENADILAAFLYWETITTTASEAAGVQFRGASLDVTNTAVVRQSSVALGGPTASCWSSGGSTLTMTMFRA